MKNAPFILVLLEEHGHRTSILVDCVLYYILRIKFCIAIATKQHFKVCIATRIVMWISNLDGISQKRWRCVLACASSILNEYELKNFFLLLPEVFPVGAVFGPFFLGRSMFFLRFTYLYAFVIFCHKCVYRPFKY